MKRDFIDSFLNFVKRSGKNAVPVWVIAAFIFVLLSISAGGVLFYIAQASDLRRKAENELMAIARLKAAQVALWRSERLIDAGLIGESQMLAETAIRWLSAPSPSDSRYILEKFKRFEAIYTYDDIFLVDRTGSIRLSLNNTRTKLHEEVLGRLADALREGKPYLTDLHTYFDDIYPHIDVIAPLLGAVRTRPMAAVILCINADRYLYPMIKAWPLPGDSGETLIVRREGDRVMYLNELRHRENTALNLLLPLDQADLPSAMAAKGMKGIVEGRDYRGVRVLAVIEQIPDSGWRLVAKIDEKEIFREWRFRGAMILSLVFLLLTMTFGGFSLVLQRQRSSHVKEMLKAAIDRQMLRRHFEYLIKHANDAIILADENLHIIEANNRFIEIYGYALEDISDLAVFDLIVPEEVDTIRQRLSQIGEEGALISEGNHRRKDGAVFPAELSARFIEVEGRKWFQAIIRDITERKRAEAALRENEEKFRSLFEYSTVGKSLTSPEGRLLHVNSALADMLGYTVEELQRISFSDITHPDDMAESRESIRCLIENEREFYRFEKRYFHKNGGVLWTDVSTRLVRDAAGKPEYFITSVLNITDRKHAEEELRASERRYRTLFESMLNGFAYCKIIFEKGAPADFVYLDVNGAFERLTGLKNVTGKRVSEVIPGIHQSDPGLLEIYAKAALTGKPETFEMHLQALDMWFSVAVYSMEKEYFVAVFDVITERKRAEIALQESKRELQVLMDAAPVGISWADKEGKIQYINRNFHELFGYTVEDLSDISTWRSLAYPDPAYRDTIPSLISLLDEARKQGKEAAPIEVSVTCKDGSVRQVIQAGVFASNRILAIYNDITERKRAEEEVRTLNEELERRVIDRTARLEEAKSAIAENAMRIEDLYNRAPCGYHSLDENGVFMEINDTELGWLGYAREEVVGRLSFRDLITEDSRKVFEANFPAFKERGYVYNLEFDMVRKDGSIFPVIVNAGAIRDDLGRYVRSRSTVMDFSEVKRAREDMVLYSAKLEALNKELEAFSYSVSHDLRAPLRAIDGFSQVIIEDYAERLDEKGRNYLDRIRASSQRMALLIDDILTLSRVGRSEMHFSPTDLSGLARAAAAELSEKEPERDARFIIKENVKVDGDPALLRIVMENLVGNAWKFTSKRRGAEIEFGTMQFDEDDVFFVRDNGAGFDMKYAERLFGAFQRLHSTQEFEGTGIGLTLVQRIINRHGGRIWAEGETDKGATIFFTLPSPQKERLNG